MAAGCQPPAAASSANTYFIDSQVGNDRNAGTSPDQAWQTLEQINKVTFQPGDQILVKTGTRYEGHLAPKGSGREGQPIVLQTYGEGPKPLIEGLVREPETLLLYNVEHWEVRDLEITNLWEERQANLAGVRVKLDNFGTAHHIHLKNLTVRDVNGSFMKKEGGGTGITCDNGGDQVKSRFDGLLIENCHLIRTDRDGIALRSEHKTRDDGWFPSLNVVIRKNLLEDIGGDGVVPRGCEGALVEHNVLRGGRTRCDDYAAGIWLHSSDNTVIQFNEVSGMVGTKDGQGFDSDYNCRNTLIQYNYSHDNDGGFILVCNSGTGLPTNMGNQGTVVRYNISQNDGHRIFYITGPVRNVQIYNNTIYTGKHLDI